MKQVEIKLFFLVRFNFIVFVVILVTYGPETCAFFSKFLRLRVDVVLLEYRSSTHRYSNT